MMMMTKSSMMKRVIATSYRVLITTITTTIIIIIINNNIIIVNITSPFQIIIITIIHIVHHCDDVSPEHIDKSSLDLSPADSRSLPHRRLVALA